MTAAIRGAGAVPAWIGLVHGAVIVGLDDDELRRFATEDGVTKVARRDVPFALAAGERGATTVSATIWAAHRAGIGIGATGGIGGVHRAPTPTSRPTSSSSRGPPSCWCAAGRSRSSTARSRPRSSRSSGVAVVGYGTDRLAGFLASRTRGRWSIASTGRSRRRRSRPRGHAGIDAAILLCHPVPAASALPPEEVDAATAAAQAALEAEAVTGKAVTPFLLVGDRRARRAAGRWRRTSTCWRTTRASRPRWRSRSAQPGLDDDLREVPAVAQVPRLLRGAARPRPRSSRAPPPPERGAAAPRSGSRSSRTGPARGPGAGAGRCGPPGSRSTGR